MFIWSTPTTRQSVNLSTCSPTTAWRIMFPPKLTTYRWPTRRRCIPRPPSVDVIDVGLSDHRLLRWPVSRKTADTSLHHSSDHGVSLTLRPSARRSVVVVTVPTDGLARLYDSGDLCLRRLHQTRKYVPDLEIYIDSDTSKKTHVADRVQLFCISASHTQHPSLRLLA